MPEPTLKVTIDEWDWTDTKALFTKQDKVGDGLAIWADYQIRNRYEGDQRIYMMGNTDPDGFGQDRDTVSFVQLASPTLLWITDWTAARFNAVPNIPDPNPTNVDWVLLDIHLETASLVVPTDGQSPYYRISGTYFYGHKRPPRYPLSVMCFPRPPWLQDTPPRFIDPAIFEKNLNTPKNPRPIIDNPIILQR